MARRLSTSVVMRIRQAAGVERSIEKLKARKLEIFKSVMDDLEPGDAISYVEASDHVAYRMRPDRSWASVGLGLPVKTDHLLRLLAEGRAFVVEKED